MRYLKLCISVLVTGAVLLLGWWCWHVTQTVSALEQHIKIHEVTTAELLATSAKIVELNSLRQTHLENVLLYSQEVRAAFRQIDAYNERMPPTRLVRHKRAKDEALGGGDSATWRKP